MRKRMSIFTMMMALVIMALLMVVPALAENTGSADWDNPIGGIGDLINHGHGYTDANTQRAKRIAVGVGVDLIVHERTINQNNLTPLRTTVEGKWDIANKNGGVYVVATYHAADVWKGLVDLVGLGE